MPDFNVRSDSVNVEQIMEQIRGRIREKRGVDYSEDQIRELATVKLEKILDPRGVRSDLLEQFRRTPPPPERPNYVFGEETLYETHRGPIRWIRSLLRPILKLLFNPNPLIQALYIQSQLNTLNARRESDRYALDQLNYELVHNLVVELTRLGIEVRTVRMRAESLASRLEFNERRARALESVVVYKPGDEREAPAASVGRAVSQFQPPAMQSPASSSTVQEPQGRPEQGRETTSSGQATSTSPGQAEGPGQRSRRRRRRRGRRGGGSAAAMMGPGSAPKTPADSGPADSHEPAIETGGRESGESAADSRPPDDDAQ